MTIIDKQADATGYRTQGSMTQMLRDLNLPSLQSRRRENRLTFLFKISQGLTPAIPRDNYLTQIKNKRTIRAKKFEDCVSNNFVDRKQTLNKNSYKLTEAETNLYKNSFFPRTIEEWNQLENVSAVTVEDFRRQIRALH